MTTRRPNDLMPGLSVLEGGQSYDDLFTAQPMNVPGVNLPGTSSVKPPTKTQLAEQAAAQRAQAVEAMRQRLNLLRNDPKWTNASLERREEMFNNWRKTQFDPYLQNIQDEDLRTAISRLPYDTLGADIQTLRGAIQDGSQLWDTGLGVASTAMSLQTAVADQFPAVMANRAIDTIDRAIAENRPISTWEWMNMPVNTLAMHWQGKSLEEIRQFAYDERARQVAENQQSQQAIANVRSGLSIGAGDRAAERREDQAQYGDFMGTMYNLGSHPLNTLGETVEQVPNIALAIGASAAGGLPGASAAGAILTGQDAMASAIEAVGQIPEEQLMTLPAYQELRARGVSAEDAKTTLALRAGDDSSLYGALIGMALGPLGVEYAAGRAVTGRVASGTVGTRVASGLGRTALEGGEEALTQLSGNYAAGDVTGAPVGIMQGVGEAGALGIGVAGPISIATTAAEIRNGAPQTPTATRPEVPAQEGDIGTVPSAEQAAQSEVDTSMLAAQESALQAVYDTVTSIRQTTDGSAISPAEIDTLFGRIYSAEESGADVGNIIEAMDVLRQARPYNGTGTLTTAYQQYAQQRLAAGVDQVAQSISGDQSGTTSTTTDTTSRTSSDTNGAITETTQGNPAQTTDNSATTTQGDAEASVRGAAGNVQSATQVSQGSTVQVGNNAAATSSISGDANTTAATQSSSVSASQRSGAQTAGPSTTSPGGSTSPSSFTTGQVSPAVGSTVTYRSDAAGAVNIEGDITSMSKDGTTFTLRARSGVEYKNLPTSSIRQVEGGPNETTTTTSNQTSQNPQGAPASVQTPSGSQAAPTAGGNPGQSGGGAIPNIGAATSDIGSANQAVRSDATSSGRDLRQDPTARETSGAGVSDTTGSEVRGNESYTTPEGVSNPLTSEEQVTLLNEYYGMEEHLSDDIDSFDAFVDAAVQDSLLMEAGMEPNTTILSRLSTAARKILDKLVMAFMAVATALTINMTMPINDAMAQTGISEVTTVTQVAGASQSVSVVNSWVQGTRDNNGQSYIIADKEGGMIYVMAADGRVLQQAPALYGRKEGDGMTVGETPAGIFSIVNRGAPAAYGGDIQQFATAPGGDIYAVHRVLTNNPSQNRQGRLDSITAGDNRVSLGCINVPTDFYNQYMQGSFEGKLYIIPEQQALGEVFEGIDRFDAKQDLLPGTILPEDFTDSASPVYRSSTVNEARPEYKAAEPKTGAIFTDVMSSPDMGLGMNLSAMAEPSTNANFAWAGLMGGLSLNGWIGTRLARFRRRATPGQGAGNTSTAPQSASQILDKYVVRDDAHRVDANETKQRLITQGNLQDTFLKTIMDKLVDGDFGFAQWTNRAGLVQSGREFDSSDLYMTYKQIPGQRSNIENELASQLYKPLEDLFVGIGKKMGVDPDVVATHLGIWTTMQHIPEGNAALRRTLVNTVNDAVLNGSIDEIAEAQTALKAFDTYQATGQGQVRTAGGMTDAQARVKAKEIESYGYDSADLQAAANGITGAVNSITQTLVQDGILLQEEVDQWRATNQFKHYVPLYIDQNPDNADGGLGTSGLNPTQMHRREGSLDIANHAVVTLRQYLYRAAAQRAAKPFKNLLAETFEAMQTNGELAGMKKINLASPMNVGDVARTRGILNLEKSIGDAGQVQYRTYKYYFDDASIMEGMEHSKEVEPRWGLARGLAYATNLHARLNTKYRLMFPVYNFLREGWERATSISSKELYRADGTKVGLAEAAAKMYVGSLNPFNIATMARHIVKGDNINAPLVQAYEELKSFGSMSSYVQVLERGKQGYRAELRRHKFAGKVLHNLDKFFDNWNEVFTTAAAAGSYKALSDMGVPKREAAFRTLDAFNIHNRAQYTQMLRTIYPFVTPTMEGSRNLVRNLSSRRGQLLFTGQVLMAATLYSLAQQFAPDDPDYGDEMNATPMNAMSRFIPLYLPDGSLIKIPVSFGSSRLSWVVGMGLNRLTQGATTPGEFMMNVMTTLSQETQPTDLAFDTMSDNVVVGLLLAATPQILTPAVELGINKMNFFGMRIHGDKGRDEHAADKGFARTPQVWVDLAQSINRASGGMIDFYPESLKYLAQSYLVGPLSGITTALEGSDQYMTGGELTTRQEIGPLADSLGVAALWNNGNGVYKRAYYTYMDQHYDILRQYNVTASDPENRRHPGQKAERAADRLRNAGASMDEALYVQYSIEYDAKLRSLSDKLRESVRNLRRSGSDLEQLTPEFDAFQRDQERLMREYIRAVRRLNI